MTDLDTRSSIPLPPDAAGGPMPTGAEEADVAPAVTRFGTGNEGYATLVWRRFRRSTMGMIGLVLVVLLLLVSIFADFFAPMDPKAANLPFAPPDVIAPVWWQRCCCSRSVRRMTTSSPTMPSPAATWSRSCSAPRP